MHVLVLPSWYPTREAPAQGRYFADQAQALRRAGATVGVVYPELRSLRKASPRLLRRNHFQRSAAREQGVPTLRSHGWNIGWRSSLGARWRIREAGRLAARYAHRRGRPSVVHAHSGRWAATAAARLSERWGVPYVVTEHFSGFQRGVAFRWERRLARRALLGADGVAAVSTSLKRYLLENGFARSARVLPNLVDTDFFTPPPSPPRQSPRRGTSFRLLALGHLVRHKGHHVLLEALAQRVAGTEGARLEIGGAGPERAALERQAARLGIGQRVLFLGPLDRAGVRRALWRADALVLPSLRETFGVTLIEAMATGLPVVATRSGGPEDIVTPRTGLLVPPGNASALAEALAEGVERRAFFQSAAIRTYAKRHFGSEAVARQLLHFYREACGKS